MNIKAATAGSLIGSWVLAFISPDENQLRGHIEYAKEKGNKTPRRKPGDRFVLFGSLAGVIAGGILGSRTGVPSLIVAGVIGGGILEGIIGSYVPVLIRKYREYRNSKDRSNP